jgi:hypothetical protein
MSGIIYGPVQTNSKEGKETIVPLEKLKQFLDGSKDRR